MTLPSQAIRTTPTLAPLHPHLTSQVKPSNTIPSPSLALPPLASTAIQTHFHCTAWSTPSPSLSLCLLRNSKKQHLLCWILTGFLHSCKTAATLSGSHLSTPGACVSTLTTALTWAHTLMHFLRESIIS